MSDVSHAATEHANLVWREVQMQAQETMGGPIITLRFEELMRRLCEAFEAGAAWHGTPAPIDGDEHA